VDSNIRLLEKNGYNQNPTRCERKLLNLKSKYKSVKIHNKQTGNDPKSCSFYDELEDIFGKSPAICPVATCSNIKGADVLPESKIEKGAKNKRTLPQINEEIPAKHDSPSAGSVGSSSESGKLEKACSLKLKKPKETMLKALKDLSEKGR